MKTSIPRFLTTFLCLLGGATQASPNAAVLASEELAVVQAIAAIANREARFPFDFLYFESDFSASRHVASSMSNPERTAYCGLTREQGMALVNELKLLDSSPVIFDKDVAKPAGLELGQKKLERFRYLMVSRVVRRLGAHRSWLSRQWRVRTMGALTAGRPGTTW